MITSLGVRLALMVLSDGVKFVSLVDGLAKLITSYKLSIKFQEE